MKSNTKVLEKANKPKIFKKKGKTATKGETRSAWALIAPYAIAFSLFILVPTILAIILSFTYFNAIEFPTWIGFTNYITLLTQDTEFFRTILPNTIQYAVLVGVGGFVLSFFVAWLLSQVQKGPRTVMALIIYSPSMVGPVFVTVLFQSLFSGDESGFLNAFLLERGFIDTPIQFLLSPDLLFPITIFVALWSSMGIGFLSMLAGILNVDKELYEAAYIDGIKNRFQEVIYITIPQMKPQMLFGAVMAIVNAFNSGWIGVALSGSNPTPQYSASVITNHIDDYGFQRYEMGYASAISVVLLIIVYVISQVANKLLSDDD